MRQAAVLSRRQRKKRRRLGWKLLILGVLCLVAAVQIDARLRPLMTTAFTYQAQLHATRAINNAVLEVIDEEDLRYESIIHTQTNDVGRVTFLETDMVAMNRLKSEISNAVSDRLVRVAQEEIELPMGTLLGGNFLSGRGPEIGFRLIPAGYVVTDFYNEFQEAGINQTLHQVVITIQVPVNAMLPLYNVTTEISTSVCVAESIIVGEVPQSFTEINGDNRGLLDQVNDYAAAAG